MAKVWTSSKPATLICNAGSTGDLRKTVAEYTAEEIQAYYDMNIISYTTLISGFLDIFSCCKTYIINISSLLAVQPFANWGLYASGKAARDMLLQVIAKENKEGSVRTLSYAPGPLDNTMQKHVRETLGDPEQAKLYTDMATQGKLVSMESSAKKLVDILQKDVFVSGAHIDYFDDDI
ncbi:hypothetical protein BCR43DRAFT_487976 [Syncephalastrum racemosum]|uniref:Sepiapterin reductase n=1 Tax=Syncephalastrum racemosum TaxID=13706 RepID=A0A1X2HJB4_SYNRA|nr:hypothetical protein BCR43DRAFT_487976 [Syncephalastrum racemosum]